MGDITELLQQARGGDAAARDELFRRVYAELKHLAQRKLAGNSPMTLLDSTSLVQEAFIRMSGQGQVPGINRNAFFAYAAQVMRSVIVSYARNRLALKRGGNEIRVTLTGTKIAAPMREADLEALDSALEVLKKLDERAHQVVEMRYFAGLSIEEIADVLSLSPATVKRDWEKARAILFKLMEG